MSARYCGRLCCRCLQPVFVGRYSSGSSLCEDCAQDVREEAEDDARQELANAEELEDAQ